MLHHNLSFISRFYETASEPLLDAIRKIEIHKEPYDRFAPQAEPPPLLQEWLDNEESANLLTKQCLCLVQQSFKEFLDGFIERNNQYGLGNIKRKSPLKYDGENWFEAYKRFFFEECHINWANSPVDLELIEEISLIRNDIHPGTFSQIENFSRFPISVFVDEWEQFESRKRANSAKPCPIMITRANLFVAILAIGDFCAYLDGEWQKQPI